MNGGRRPLFVRAAAACLGLVACGLGTTDAWAQARTKTNSEPQAESKPEVLPGKPATAPGPSRDHQVITNERLEAAKRLLVATGTRAAFEAAIDEVARRLAAQLKAERPDNAAAIDTIYAELAKRYRARSEDALVLVAPLYAERFTSAELDEARRFYESSVGRRFAASQSEIAVRSQQLGHAWGKRIAAQLRRDAAAALEERGVQPGKPATVK